MRQLSLDGLRTLVAIHDLGGFAKAGEWLGRSQPAISLQIKKLEEQLGKKLFDKTGQRQLLNHDGHTVYEHAQKILTINDELFSQFEQTSISGRLRLGIPSEFASTLLPSIVGEFSKLYPDVALEVTSSLSKTLLSEQHHASFDLVLALTAPDTENPGEVILRDELVWVGDTRHPLPNKNIPLVLAPSGCMYRSRVIEKLKQQTHQWRISYTNADLFGLSAAIEQGLGVTALAKSSVPKHLHILKHASLPALGHINISLFSQSSLHPQANAKLAEFIKRRLS